MANTDDTPDASVRELIHQVNNLLSVVRLQLAAARAQAHSPQTQRALELIERSAERTEEVVARAARTLRR